MLRPFIVKVSVLGYFPLVSSANKIGFKLFKFVGVINI